MEKTLEKLYTDPRAPGSFSGVQKIKKGLEKSKNLKVRVDELKKYLRKKDTYTKFRYARRNFKRNPVIAPYIDAQWQADLADMQKLARYNNGVRFLLIVIDIVSKFLWVEPLKSKTAIDVLAAFEKIFNETERRPKKFQTDAGTEFTNSGLQKYLEKQDIIYFTLRSEKKAAVAERVVRTIKEKIWKYMHEMHTDTYVDALQDLVHSYNNTYHTSIKMAPVEVTKANEGDVLENLYGKAWAEDKKQIKPLLRVGDFVRISIEKGKFEKGYTGYWHEEIFIIHEIKESARPRIMYKLKDWHGTVLEGSFYEEEVQLVDKDLYGFWLVEEVVETKKVKGRTMHLVKWLGYPESMNEWVYAEDTTKVGDKRK